MEPPENPRILILDRSQQGRFRWSEILTDEVLADVVQRVTGREDFEPEWVEWDTEAFFNSGRLARIIYQGMTTYVTFSPHGEIDGRNSCIQSVPSALSRFYLNDRFLYTGTSSLRSQQWQDELMEDLDPGHEICFYFLANHGQDHNIGYLRLMYRIMATAGIRFLNPERCISDLHRPIIPFNSIDDLRRFRVENTGNATAPNQPTYIAMHPGRGLEVFVKTYGANKKEAVLLIHALSCIAPDDFTINVYMHDEQYLDQLPATDLRVIEELVNVEVTNLDFAIECADDDGQGDIRNQPVFIRNLLERFGTHRCMFCGEDNEILVQGAHIWDIWQIRLDNTINFEQRRIHANHGENGLWLCRTHHAQFDNPQTAPQLGINAEGRILVHNELAAEIVETLRQQIESPTIPQRFVTDAFAEYVTRRYEHHIQAEDYQPLHENLE